MLHRQLLRMALGTGLCLFSDLPTFSQEFASAVILQDDKKGEKRRSLQSVLTELEAEYHVHLNYESKVIENKYVPAQPSRRSGKNLEAQLHRLLQPLSLKFKQVSGDYYIIYPEGEKKSIEKIEAAKGEDNTSGRDTSEDIFYPMQSVNNMLRQTLNQSQVNALAISGQVSDDNGNGLPGVTVLVKGTTNGTTTDAEGKYTLNAPDGNGTLVFSFIGYVTEEVPINNRSAINVSLVPDIKALNEVVVIGYGQQKKADLTSSIAVVSSEDMARAPVASFQQAIQGLSPGVSVEMGKAAPGNGAKVRIRGVGSVNNTDPLYVIDGVPVGGPGSTNMNDIESIQILKDAAACAIYGSRGANGVVLITTKRGKKGELKISGFTSYGVQQPWKKLDLLNNQEYALIMNEAATNAGLKPPARVMDILNDSTGRYGPGTDWQDAVFRTAPIQEHNLSFSGGTDLMNFNVSGGYFNQEGILINTNFSKYYLRINTDFKRGKFKFGESLGLNYSRKRNPIVSGGREILEHMVKQTSAVPIYDPANIPGGFGGAEAIDDQDAENPVLVSSRTIDLDHAFGLLGNVYGEYEIIKGLRLRANIAGLYSLCIIYWTLVDLHEKHNRDGDKFTLISGKHT